VYATHITKNYSPQENLAAITTGFKKRKMGSM
jgi:hypothetical protein